MFSNLFGKEITQMQEMVNKLWVYLLPFGLNLLAAIIIFIVGKWLAKLVENIAESVMIKAKVNKTLASFAKHMAYFIILLFVIIASLNKIGIETNSFIAIIGAAGLAVGLALQGSLANFAAGVMLILFQPFDVGDFIEAGGAAGVVKEVQIFNTLITTADNKRVIVPNAKITSDKIVIHPKA
jgi:small conductance mechanosensitive channel